jgi:hypothetical protein
MTSQPDFEKAWLEKLSQGLDGRASKENKADILSGSEQLSDVSKRETIIDWSIQAMSKLDKLVDDEQTRHDILTACACHYPKEQLQLIKEEYAQTRNIKQAHQRLQDQFEAFLSKGLNLDEDMIEEVVSRGWGLAGIIEGNTVIATKIPKSENLKAYLTETDPDKRRQYYCHCRRVRDILKSDQELSVTYCYCGAGYYQGIWEEILQQPVEVEVLESLMKGDLVCKIAVHLPD